MSKGAQLFRLTHDTMHDISKRFDITVEQLMSMLANAEDWKIEYQFVQMDPPEENWIPGAWWRVYDPYGKEIYAGTDEEAARKLTMDGCVLHRNYVLPSQTKWKKVN